MKELLASHSASLVVTWFLSMMEVKGITPTSRQAARAAFPESINPLRAARSLAGTDVPSGIQHPILKGVSEFPTVSKCCLRGEGRHVQQEVSACGVRPWSLASR